MINIYICLLQLEIIPVDCIIEPQQAAIPWKAIIDLVLALIAIGGIGAGVYLIISGKRPKVVYEDKEKVRLAILGPNEAGKTTLWNYFAGKPSSNIYKQTEGIQTVSFIASGIAWCTIKPINIKVEGPDINGHGDYIRIKWSEIIKDSDMIIFVFNAKKYLDEHEYQRDVNQRLHFVKYTIDKKCDERERNVWLLGSYADKLINPKKDWRKVIDEIKKKPYHDISNNNACLNLTDEKVLEEYYKKMFGKKDEH